MRIALLLALAASLEAQMVMPVMHGGGERFTYYVSPTGSDAANGTSAVTPWQTVSKVNGTTLTAGQRVGFKRGGTWRETLTPGQSGTTGKPITFGAYGSGAKPIISGSNVATGWAAATGGDTGGLFIANAETNDTTQFTSVTTGGTATFAVGSILNSGAHGFTSTADGTNSALGSKTVSAQTHLFVRFYFRVSSGYSLTEAQDQVLLAIEDGGGQVIRVGIRSSSGVLTMFVSDRVLFSLYSTGGLVTTNVWHKVLVEYVASATVGGASAVLDDTDTIGSNFTLNTSTHSATVIRIGINATSDAKLGSGSVVAFDDIKADTATIGNVPSAPASVYSASWATSTPNVVFQSDTKLVKVASLAAITGAGQWFYDGTTTLYVRTTTSASPTGFTMEAGTRLNGINIADKSYIAIDSLQVEKTNDTNKGAIWAHTSTGTNTTNVSVRNSTVAFGMSGIMFQSVNNAVATGNTIYGDMSTDLSGVYTEQLAAAQSMQSPTVSYNTFHDLAFCTIQPITGVTINSVNGTWSHNICYNTANYGLHFNLATSPTIEYNIVHDGGSPTQDTHGIHWADTTGAIVRYNEVYNWRDPQNWSGGGYQADNNSDNSVIYGNIAHDNDGCGFSILNSAGVLVYHNTSYNNSQHQNFGEFCIQSPNNVGLNKASATLKNNLGFPVKAGTYAVFVDANSEAHTQVIDNNLWYISSGNWWYHGGQASGINLTGGTAGSSLATWNAVSYVATDLNANPLLTNPGAGDFTIPTNSPAYQTGVFISGVSTSATPNIGSK